MIWFLTASTLLMALALLVPARAGVWRRRALEIALLLILALPILRAVIPAAPESASPNWLGQIRVPEYTLSAGLVTLWGLGVLVGGVISLRQFLQVGRLFRGSRALNDRECRHVSGLLHLRESCVERQFRLSSDIMTPVALPTLPGCVLLPTDWQTWAPRLQLGALRHEWHHVTHQDAILGCLIRVFCLAFWFHPLAWHLAAQWMAACEHEADRAAVAGADPVHYAGDLLAFAVRCSRREQSLPLGLPAFTRSALARRIELLFDTSGSRGRSRTIALLCIFLLVCSAIFCGWIASRQPAAAIPSSEVTLRLSADAFPAD